MDGLTAGGEGHLHIIQTKQTLSLPKSVTVDNAHSQAGVHPTYHTSPMDFLVNMVAQNQLGQVGTRFRNGHLE